jgi:DNA-directed RNA polymerase specialized sigma24 family protein
MNKKFRDSDDLDYMANVPAKVGSSFIEQLMAGPSHVSSETFDNPIRELVSSAINKLVERDKFIIEAVYIWGHSYSQIADMMGYGSKSTIHKILNEAQTNLKNILMEEPLVLEMLGETDDDME